MELKAKTSIRIQRPVKEVFDAIVDPRKLEGFFISSASGPLQAGRTVKWDWKDHDARADVSVERVEQEQLIVSFGRPEAGIPRSHSPSAKMAAAPISVSEN